MIFEALFQNGDHDPPVLKLPRQHCARIGPDARLRLLAIDAEAVLDHLAEELRAEKKYHELFDALLMRARRRLGLPVVMSQSLDELPEPLRAQVEEAYLDSCRQVAQYWNGWTSAVHP